MSSSQNQQHENETPKQSPNEILTKLKRFIANSPSPKTPPPLPYLAWTTINALEASLLITIVSTSQKLHDLARLSTTWHPQLSRMTRESSKLWSQIMESASICSNTLNKMREGRFRGNPALLEVILGVLRHVRYTHNPVLANVKLGPQGNREWVFACWRFVKGMVASVEHAASVLRSAGFA